MQRFIKARSLAVSSLAVAAFVVWTLGSSAPRAEADANSLRAGPDREGADRPVLDNAKRMLDEGRRTFRFATFGDEAFWGDTLRLHQAIAGARLGGVGPGVSPKAALGAGLKVDVAALPRDLQERLRKGRVDLDDPATTLALLQLDSVVGVRGFFSGGRLTSIGIQCALRHSTVDDSFAPGIGRRLDG